MIAHIYDTVWLQAPNDAFHGIKPLEVIERCETNRSTLHLTSPAVPPTSPPPVPGGG
jgi:hypothetical protein